MPYFAVPRLFLMRRAIVELGSRAAHVRTATNLDRAQKLRLECLMSDNLSIQKPVDPNGINIHEEWELTYWTKLLGTSEGDLREAVMAVGPKTEAVRKHLGKRQTPS